MWHNFYHWTEHFIVISTMIGAVLLSILLILVLIVLIGEWMGWC